MLRCQQVSVSRAHNAQADPMLCTSCVIGVKHPLRHVGRNMAVPLADQQASVLDNTHPLQQSLVHRCRLAYVSTARSLVGADQL